MKTETIWTPERISDVKTRHGISIVYLLRRHGADALGFRKDDVFIVAAGSIAGKRDKRCGGAYFRWRDKLDALKWANADGILFEDEKFTSASCAAVVVSGVPADSRWWKKL